MPKFQKPEIDYIYQNYLRLTTTEMADALGRTRSSIQNFLRRFQLIRPPEVRRKMQASGFFPKGHIPANKGQRGYRYSPATEFKRGHIPHNTKFDGAVSVRRDKRTGKQYKFIRISLNRWDLLHRVVWRRHFGEISRRDVIVFRNGNTLDCRPENLEKITMQEHINRNRNYESPGQLAQYLTGKAGRKDPELKQEAKKHPELLELKKLQLQLRRAINEQHSA